MIWTLAQLTAVLANVNRSKDATAFEVADFVPRWLTDVPALTDEQEWDEMDTHFEAFNAQFPVTGAA